MSRWVRITLAVILLLIGGVWFFQGIGVLPGSFMTGSTLWAVIGAVLIFAGAWLLNGLRRTGR